MELVEASLKTRLKSYLIIVIVILAYIGAWFSLCYILGTSNPIVVVEGSSMYPNLTKGDIVFLKGVSKEELAEDFKVGIKDIIVYSLPTGKNIIHRIYSVVYDKNGNIIGFLTKGDNNPYIDGIVVTEDMIIGKVVFGPIPYVGFLVLFLRSPPGFILLIILTAFIILWGIAEKGAKEKGSSNHVENARKE